MTKKPRSTAPIITPRVNAILRRLAPPLPPSIDPPTDAAPKKRLRKSGSSEKRRREARRLIRDRRIYRILRHTIAKSKSRHRLKREKIEALTVFSGKPHLPWLSAFPVTQQEDGKPMPRWQDLSSWLKAQVLVMAFDEWSMQTFTIHVHADLEAKWMREGKDVLKQLRDRMREEMATALGRRTSEHFFIVEGWSKFHKAPTKLHIHGAGFIAERGDAIKIMEAAARACGQGLRGLPKEPRAVHGKLYTKPGPRYINYLFKSVGRPDARLDRRRAVISSEATKAGRELWQMMTEPR